MKKTTCLFVLTFIAIMNVLTNNSIAQELRLPGIFGDHMVLQRDQPVRLWGWAEPNAKVTVKIDDFTINSQSDMHGDWELLLPAHDAGGPYKLSIRSSGMTVQFQDIYYGDVWLAGGQSNMEWKIGWKVDNLEAELRDSDYPAVRFFEVPNELSAEVKSDISGGQWTPVSPKTVNDMSAVGWFFAKLNHKEEKVAVGIIDSNWGGTPAEAWLDARRARAVHGYKKQAESVLDPAVNWAQKIAANNANEQLKWKLLQDTETVIKIGTNLETYPDKNWRPVQLPNSQPLSDFAWLKKTVRIDQPPGAKAQLSLGDLVQEAFIFFNNTLLAGKGWQDKVVPYDISAELFKPGDNIIAIRVANSWDNKVTAGKPGEMWLNVNGAIINLEGEWLYTNDIEPKMPVVERYNWMPGFLFNAMIKPIAGYSIKGVIWYQGESNDERPELYADLFKALITDWRGHWKQDRLPFLFVQLANFMQRHAVQPDSKWALLREAQAAALDLPDTGMAVALDIGVADDVHPKNKQDVAKRLWLNARKVVFHDELIYSGPIYKTLQVEGDKISVIYDHVGKGLVADKNDEVKGFVLAGADKKFYPAYAKIDNNRVIVTSTQVRQPVAVRYGWADNPDVNLYNSEGLPAAPFRTDNW